jgi:hypothetical protein
VVVVRWRTERMNIHIFRYEIMYIDGDDEEQKQVLP